MPGCRHRAWSTITIYAASVATLEKLAASIGRKRYELLVRTENSLNEEDALEVAKKLMF
jgi:hypothetical protein